MPVSDHKNVKEFRGVIRIDEATLGAIIEHFHVRLVIYANEMLNDLEKSRDAVSTMFMDLWNRRDRLEFQNEKLLKGYLYEVTRNKTIDLIRRDVKEQTELRHYSYYENVIHLPEEDHALYMAEAITVVRNAIKELTPQYRAVLELLLEDKSLDEIAETLHIKPSTVRSNKIRALEMLREKINGHVLFSFAILLLSLHNC